MRKYVDFWGTFSVPEKKIGTASYSPSYVMLSCVIPHLSKLCTFEHFNIGFDDVKPNFRQILSCTHIFNGFLNIVEFVNLQFMRLSNDFDILISLVLDQSA